MLNLDRVLATVVEADASDLILKTGCQPAIKQTGRVMFLSEDPVTSDGMRSTLERITYPEVLKRFEKLGGGLRLPERRMGPLSRQRVPPMR